MRIIAFYLPQYHEIEENNKWWGPGFTEWHTVKNAQKYQKDQYQPKIPLHNNYYKLDAEDGGTIKWQADLANIYGIYGFCFYHYWFKNNKKMLYKPVEILKNHEEINVRYCFCWANEPWRRTWYAGNSEVLIEQDYGSESDWERHYKYLSEFFKDNRYIKVDNKPMIIIYKTKSIKCLPEMVKKWNELAEHDGFDGIYLISERNAFEQEDRNILFDAYCDFEPALTLHYRLNKYENINRIIKRYTKRFINKISKNKRIENVLDIKVLYAKMGNEKEHFSKPVYPGICPMWDNTPRKYEKGLYLKNSSPSLFYNKLLDIRKNYSNDTFVFVNAWNEWSEGAYLEPDSQNRYGYLEAIKAAQE